MLKFLIESCIALGTGAVVGLLFGVLRLPVPAPPAIQGVFGIFGITIGYLIMTKLRGA